MQYFWLERVFAHLSFNNLKGNLRFSGVNLLAGHIENSG